MVAAIRSLFQPSEEVSSEELQKGFRAIIWDGMCTQAMGVLTGGVFLVAFALALGASNFHIGLLAAIPFLAQLLQIPAIYLVEKVRARRGICVAFSGASRLFWLPIAAIPLLFAAHTGMGLYVLIAALLDTEKPVSGVTAQPIRPEIQNIALITREGGGQLQPRELAVTAGWGHAGQNGVVMPGKGKAVERDYTVEEKQSTVGGAEKQGIPAQKAFELLGERTFDIYLNDVAYWKNVPTKVWEYAIGGYQVIKKWLSYREAGLLGRSLTPDEAREVMNMARRIAAIILLQPALDENYDECKRTNCRLCP